jgi:hypothetical protein
MHISIQSILILYFIVIILIVLLSAYSSLSSLSLLRTYCRVLLAEQPLADHHCHDRWAANLVQKYLEQASIHNSPLS